MDRVALEVPVVAVAAPANEGVDAAPKILEAEVVFDAASILIMSVTEL